MFKDNDAFASFSVDDIEAAREFYADTLGLAATRRAEHYLDITLGNGGQVLAYLKPDHEPATFTVLNFFAPDVEQAVDDLTAAGVQVVHYDLPDFKTDARGIARNEIGRRVAWFTDPAGNTLSVQDPL